MNDASHFVHPLGLCESDRVGARTRIWAYAHVLAGATIGSDCNICDHAFVEGRVVLGDNVTVKNGVLLYDGVHVGDDVFLGPGCVFTNDLNPRAAVKKEPSELRTTVVSDGATIGANATVVCGVSIGPGAFIGAGAVVTRNVPAHALVVGNPARLLYWVCRCGERLDDDFACDSCARRYRMISEAAGLEPVET